MDNTVVNTNTAEESEVRIPLGRKLRQLTDQAKTNKEAQALVDLLKDAASRGEDHLAFKDLRDVVPSMIMNDSLWDWLRSEEIGVSGQVNQDTAAYEYTLTW